MIKKLIAGVALSTCLLGGPASAATVFVSGAASGWQTYSTEFDDDFLGVVTIGVSNEQDTIVDAELLLDNFSGTVTFTSTSGNLGFESGLAGYSPSGTVSTTTGPVAGYSPTEGANMAHMVSNNVDTSGFVNANGDPGTNGSLLTFLIDVDPGEVLNFDWNFINNEATDPGGDPTEFWDFAFIDIHSIAGASFSQYDVLAQVTPVPLPAAVWLFGSGLLGLVGMKRFRRPEEG